MRAISSTEMCLNMPSGKWRPFFSWPQCVKTFLFAIKVSICIYLTPTTMFFVHGPLWFWFSHSLTISMGDHVVRNRTQENHWKHLNSQPILKSVRFKHIQWIVFISHVFLFCTYFDFIERENIKNIKSCVQQHSGFPSAPVVSFVSVGPCTYVAEAFTNLGISDEEYPRHYVRDTSWRAWWRICQHSLLKFYLVVCRIYESPQFNFQQHQGSSSLLENN